MNPRRNIAAGAVTAETATAAKAAAAPIDAIETCRRQRPAKYSLLMTVFTFPPFSYRRPLPGLPLTFVPRSLAASLANSTAAKCRVWGY